MAEYTNTKSNNSQSPYQNLGDEYTKAMSKAMARLPIIGKSMAELDEALCNAGIGYRRRS